MLLQHNGKYIRSFEIQEGSLEQTLETLPEFVALKTEVHVVVVPNVLVNLVSLAKAP